MKNSWRTTLSCFPARFLISKKKRNASKFLSRCALSWRKRWVLVLLSVITTFHPGSDKGLHPGRSQPGVESSRQEGVEAGSKTRSGASSKLWGHHFVQRYLVPRLLETCCNFYGKGWCYSRKIIQQELFESVVWKTMSSSCEA